jgi:hypothetical protein
VTAAGAAARPASVPGSWSRRAREVAATVVDRAAAVVRTAVARWGRTPVVVVAAALVVGVVLAAALLAQPPSDAAPDAPPPAYPVVEGPLGDALVRLQHGVDP